jgi:small basic protein
VLKLYILVVGAVVGVVAEIQIVKIIYQYSEIITMSIVDAIDVGLWIVIVDHQYWY